jgi:DNA modification methylase
MKKTTVLPSPAILSSRPINELKQDEKNANRGTKRGGAMLRDSLRRSGAGRSILLDKNGRIIAGNKTAIAAGSLGMENVQVVQVDGRQLVAVQRMDLDLDTDVVAQELAIADNRVGEVSLAWDAAVLAAMSQQLNLEQFWDVGELEGVMALSALLTDEDDAPAKPAKAKTKPGQLFQLGDHRLLCGDSTLPASYTKLLDEPAQLCWTDPPYNVDYTGKTKAALRIQNDAMTPEQFRGFLAASMACITEALAPGGACYVAHNDREGLSFLGAYTAAGLHFAGCLIWHKNVMVMGRSDYQWQHEPILYGWKPGASHRWYGGRKQTTVFDVDKPSRNADHPTMKPVALVERCIRNSAAQSAIVLDPFGGSGSTLIACEKSKRRARLIELDPSYCDVIVKRWEEATGQKAVLL